MVDRACRDFCVDDGEGRSVTAQARIVDQVSIGLPRAPVFLMYTSGTTGRLGPRGTSHSTGANLVPTDRDVQVLPGTIHPRTSTGWPLAGHRLDPPGPLPTSCTGRVFELGTTTVI